MTKSKAPKNVKARKAVKAVFTRLSDMKSAHSDGLTLAHREMKRLWRSVEKEYGLDNKWHWSFNHITATFEPVRLKTSYELREQEKENK